MSEVLIDVPAGFRVFNTPELLEQILICLLEELFPRLEHEDPRSDKVNANASAQLHLLHCSEVNRAWHQCVLHGSKPIQRALFLRADHFGRRSWHVGRPFYPSQREYHEDLTFRIPILNPMLRATFPTYRLRFWKNAAEAWGPRYRAYGIIRRQDAEAARARLQTGRGRTLSKMFISQPPPTDMEANIWDRQDSADDKSNGLEKTTQLSRPIIKCDQGVTLGYMHRRLCEIFDDHHDVTAIKVTTI